MDINYSIQQQFFRPAPARGPSRFCPHPKGRWYIYIICYVAHSKYYVLHYFQNIYVTCHITASLLQMLSTARLLHQMNKIIKSLMKKKIKKNQEEHVESPKQAIQMVATAHSAEAAHASSLGLGMDCMHKPSLSAGSRCCPHASQKPGRVIIEPCVIMM